MDTTFLSTSTLSKSRFSGSFGGGGGQPEQPPPPTQTPDNLRSKDTLEVILALGEGRWLGLVDGHKSFYVGDTQLQNDNGTYNFQAFTVKFFEGAEDAEIVIPKLGGISQNTAVNVALFSGTPVVRETNTGNIDFIDVRIVFNRLMISNSSGTFDNSVKFKIEYKKVSDTVWKAGYYSRTWKAFTDTVTPGNAAAISVTVDPTLVDGEYAAQVEYRPVGGDTWELLGQATTGVQQTFLSTGLIEVPYEVRASGCTIVEKKAIVSDPHVIQTGKTSSNYTKDFRFPVDRSTENYEVRVTKVTPENTNESFSDITWESFQEINADARSYNNTALLQLVGEATDQFSSIPQFKGIYRGLIVKVPSNYDPIARTYDGEWDGIWVWAWTNNPAFILNDFVTNDRYGMSSAIPISLDKWDVYVAAQWCDEMVSDGAGGLQPRYTFNAAISEPRSSKEMAKYIAGSFNAIFFDDQNGTAILKVDKEEPALHLFSPENIEQGMFNYSFTDSTVRYNDLTVTFRNKGLLYTEDRRRVFNQPAIDRFGRTPLDFIAVGCTDAHEAVRRAQYKMITSLRETMLVSFRTNRKGLYALPFEVMLIADPDMGFALSGRIQSLNVAKTAISLRDPLYLESGVEYKISITTANGLIQRNLVGTVDGYTTTLHVDAALPDNVPEKANFSVEQQGDGIGAPKPFRIMSIKEVDGDPDQVEINGMEIYRNKWYEADNVLPVGEFQYSFKGSVSNCNPPSNLTAASSVSVSPTGMHVDVNLSWERSPDPYVRTYIGSYSRNGGPLIKFCEVNSDNTTLPNVPHGDYEFQVVAVNIAGNSSLPTITYLNIGDEAPIDLAEVTGLELYNQGNDTEFTTRDPRFTWRTNSVIGSFELGDGSGNAGFLDPTFKDYLIEIVDVDTDDVIRTDSTITNEYTYHFEKNFLDGGGTPRRRFKIRVYIRDFYNRQSKSSSLVVNNPAPPLPTNIVISNAIEASIVQFDRPSVPDYSGVRVWLDTIDGFTPSDANLVYDGPNNLIAVNLSSDDSYFIKLATYDVFGKDNLNISAQYSTSPISINTRIPEFTFTGLTFKPNDPALNSVSWTDGTVAVTANGATDVYNLAASSAAWTTGTIFIYYTAGNEFLQSSANLSDAVGVNKAILATYKGGTELVVGNGNAFISGAMLLAQTVGAAQLVTDQAVITGAAQIANAIITDAHVVSLSASKIVAAELSAVSANLGLVTAGVMQSADGTMVIDLDNKDIMIAGPAGQAADDYMRLTDGDLYFYEWTGATHEIKKSVRNVQQGTCDNGTSITIPGYFSGQPSVQVSPNALMCYNKDYANQSQSLRLSADDLTEVLPGKWSFTAAARLELSVASGTSAINETSSETSTNTWTSTTKTTPANCASIISYMSLKSVRGTGTAPNYYKRKVTWKVGYRVALSGAAWTYTSNRVKDMSITDIGFVSDQMTVTFPSSGSWEWRVETTAADTDGTSTFTYGSGGYNYSTAVVSGSPADTQQTNDVDMTVGQSVSTAVTFSYSAPPGWLVYQVDYTWSEAWYASMYGFVGGFYATVAINSQATSTSVTSSASVSDFGTGSPNSLTTLVAKAVTTSSVHSISISATCTVDTGLQVVAGVRLANASATVRIRQLITNSTTVANEFKVQQYDYFLTSAEVLATGTLNWVAVG